jgi:transposase
MVRTALYQAAHVLMHRGRWSGLRGWAMRIAKRSAAKLAKVALASKLAVILHRMWINETNFRWTIREPAPAAAI